MFLCCCLVQVVSRLGLVFWVGVGFAVWVYSLCLLLVCLLYEYSWVSLLFLGLFYCCALVVVNLVHVLLYVLRVACFVCCLNCCDVD